MAAVGDRTQWTRYAVLGMVCALIIGFYAWSANSGLLELMGSGARDSYYNLLVQGFRDGHLSVKRDMPPDLGNPAKMKWEDNFGLDDLSYYKGKLYLYFGVTPAVALFWPYAALTGHYLLHKDAVVLFFSAGFLAGAALLWAVWRRYFPETGVWAVAAGMLALGLANLAPAILARCDVYEVAISCAYALTMLALGGIWFALHDVRRSWRWLAGASLVYGLAVGARPSLLLGGIILLAPVAQGWRAKRRVWPLLAAAVVPMALIGIGLMLYNAMRFDNPLEFGQRYQLPLTLHDQFSLRYLWFNFQVGFLAPARWGGCLPFVHDIALPAQPKGYWQIDYAFGILTNIPVVWLALAAPLAWRRRPVEARSNLRWFLGAVGLLFGGCALTLLLHDSICLRYEMEYASPMLLLAVIGALAVERGLAGRPVWRWATRCGWGLLLTFSLAFNLFASFELKADKHDHFGIALERMGRVDEAITEYQQALRMRPDDVLAHYNLGDDLVRKGRVDEAIAHFQKVLQMVPDFALGHNNLGYALLQMGRVDEAIPHFQKVLQIEPDNADGHSNLGDSLLQKGRLDEAIAHLQKALEINPDKTEAHYNFGIALVRKGRLDEAITQYQEAVKLKPDYAEAHNNLGDALVQKGRVDEAIPHFQEVLRLKPDDALAHNNLGDALLQKGRVDEALPHFQKALELKPDYMEAHYNLGIALLQKGRVDEAITQYQEVLKIKPDAADAHNSLGNALLQKGRVGEAIAHFQQALQLKPADPAFQNNLAWLLATAPEASLRNGGQAMELAQKASLLTGGENPIFLHTLAAACAEARRFPEAVETAQHALRLANAQSNAGLARVLQSELKLYEAGRPFHSPQQTP